MTPILPALVIGLAVFFAGEWNPPPASPSPGASLLYGDINGDGAVTASDARTALEAITGLRSLSSKELARGDVMPRPGIAGRLAGDGKLTVADAARILAYARGFLPYARLAPEPLTTTLAGEGKPQLGGGDFTDGPAPRARFRSPWSLDVDKNGVVYVADTLNHRIRKIENGVVTTLAGGRGGKRGGWVDGPASESEFRLPLDVDVDDHGNVFVVELNHTVRKISAEGQVTTLAGNGEPGYQDGKGTEAQFAYPNSVVLLPNGDVLVADSGNDCIRRVSPEGEVTTWAGSPDRSGFRDGGPNVAEFDEPDGIAFDSKGFVYVADGHNHAIRRIDPHGYVSTLAGDGTPGSDDGTGRNAHFNVPMGLDIDAEGNLYTTEYVQETIRKISPAGDVTTVAGQAGRYGLVDGPASEARFFSPMGVACTPDGLLFIADTDNQRIRLIRQR